MYSLLQRFAGNTAAAPVLFLVLFLVIVGAALFLTPRLAAWLERKEKETKPGFYDGMLTEDPNKADDRKTAEETAGEENSREDSPGR